MVAVRHEEIGRPSRGAGRARLRVIEPAVRRVCEDALPEHTEYRDTGCELAASCLACPLARCKHDERGGAAAMAMAQRDREIAYLRRRYGAPVDLLARTYGLSRRTIFRIVRRDARRHAGEHMHEEETR